MASGDKRIKELRYQVMLALYLPILLYSFSTFDPNPGQIIASKVNPILVGGQESLVAGQDFTARAYLEAAELQSKDSGGGGSTAEITLSTDDEKVTVENDQSIRVATAGLLEEGENQTEVNYSIDMSWGFATGSDTTVTLNGSFTVRRPQLVARSTNTSSLYRKTLNELRVSIPGLENKPIRLRTSTGQTFNTRELSLSPSGDNLTVTAYLPSESGEDFKLDSQEFTVTDPPSPQVKVFNFGGEKLTSGQDLSLARPVLDFRVEPDPEFEARYPQDANYRVKRAKVEIRQGLQPSQPVGQGTYSLSEESTLRKLSVPLSRMNAQPGDRLLVELQDVVRINYRGEEIPVDLSESALSYSFTLR